MRIELYNYIHPFFQKTENKKLIAIPLTILAIALIIIASMTIYTGSPVPLGMDFVGGTQFTVTSSLSEKQFQDMFSDFPLNDIRMSGSRTILQFSQMNSDELTALERLIWDNQAFTDIDQKQVSPIYSQQLQKTALYALILSFIGMAIVIFILFRQVVSSAAVITSAASDILIAVAFMNIFRIELTLGTVAALLMLIALSVDSNILLTNRVFKRSGNLDDKLSGAMRTGLLMSTTTIAAFTVMFVVSTFLHYIVPGVPPIPLLSQISLIVLIGLLMDIINTWFLNAGVLRMYLTRSKSRSKKGGRRA
ncbi:MAG: protein translocase subunit SecF [Methanimicrococcus sp.]|nr:protein translocase subunit SecF [Methanimicrococcus sp.]